MFHVNWAVLNVWEHVQRVTFLEIISFHSANKCMRSPEIVLQPQSITLSLRPHKAAIFSVNVRVPTLLFIHRRGTRAFLPFSLLLFLTRGQNPRRGEREREESSPLERSLPWIVKSSPVNTISLSLHNTQIPLCYIYNFLFTKINIRNYCLLEMFVGIICFLSVIVIYVYVYGYMLIKD